MAREEGPASPRLCGASSEELVAMWSLPRMAPWAVSDPAVMVWALTVWAVNVPVISILPSPVMTIWRLKISTLPARGLVWSWRGARVVVILPWIPSISIKPVVRVPVMPTLWSRA